MAQKFDSRGDSIDFINLTADVADRQTDRQTGRKQEGRRAGWNAAPVLSLKKLRVAPVSAASPGIALEMYLFIADNTLSTAQGDSELLASLEIAVLPGNTGLPSGLGLTPACNLPSAPLRDCQLADGATSAFLAV
ncbi:unnamed protein product [Pleuronectes platessa]|uniref:Uncharacterized protein n=1 Tax=Pleuronectes platessa TaxID=8262 RepID=A0A9N7VG14_PLEPL|nr:unnamed protein product [Pleuronectes platessa]